MLSKTMRESSLNPLANVTAEAHLLPVTQDKNSIA